MSKAKPTAETVIHESAISRIQPVPEITTNLQLLHAPSWDRARELVHRIRGSINDVIELGLQIRDLHEEYSAHGTRNDKHAEKRGWQQKVQDELGISHTTALRLIERAESVIYMRRLQVGETIAFYNSKNEQQELVATPDLQAQATQAIEAVVAGTVAAPRAWAGLLGEATRRAAQGGSAARAAVDHGENLKKAIIKLRTSIKEWRHLNTAQRAEIETLWQEVAAMLPETW